MLIGAGRMIGREGKALCLVMTQRFDNTDGRLRGRKAQARRLRVWSADPCCAMCGVLTEYPSGFHLDHRIPLHVGGPDTDENCQVLDIRCHNLKTISERSDIKQVAYYPEWLQPVLGPLTIVFGPPGAGKSRYVSERSSQTDVVIDLDEMASTLSGLPLYHCGIQWLTKAVYARNQELSRLGYTAQRAWLIATGKGKDKRDWWQAKMKPHDTVLMDTPESICIQRIRADERRPEGVKARHIEEVKSWWMVERDPSSAPRDPGFRPKIGEDGWPV